MEIDECKSIERSSSQSGFSAHEPRLLCRARIYKRVPAGAREPTPGRWLDRKVEFQLFSTLQYVTRRLCVIKKMPERAGHESKNRILVSSTTSPARTHTYIHIAAHAPHSRVSTEHRARGFRFAAPNLSSLRKLEKAASPIPSSTLATRRSPP